MRHHVCGVSRSAPASVMAVLAGACVWGPGIAQAQPLVGYPSYSVQRLGFFGAPQTDSTGGQFSQATLLNAGGHVAGYSTRYAGSGTNGQDAWVWHGSGTVQVGLLGGVHTTSGGLQYSQASFQNDSGQISGFSYRYAGLFTVNGQDSWVWRGGASTQIGLVGGVYTGTAAYQLSQPLFQNAAGRIAGYSARISGQSADNGRDSWVWNGTTTAQIGLSGGGYLGSAGYQYSQVQGQNEAGAVIGYSNRYTGVNTSNGADAWVWNGSSSTQIGLLGGPYVGTSGFQVSLPNYLNAAGQVAGFSQRINGASFDNGRDAWVWNGSATTRIGLTGGSFTGSAGYQYSQVLGQNEAGQVVGSTQLITGVNINNGVAVWAWNGSGTVQLGFTDPEYVGGSGYQVSRIDAQNASGQVIGNSDRYLGGAGLQGRDTWVWNGAAMMRTGLSGAAYTSGTGSRSSTNITQNTAGQVVGWTTRYLGGTGPVGHDAWVFDGASTRQIGLTGGAYTGSAGYQFSQPVLQSDSGVIAGYTSRVTGVNNPNGQDAWYYDPVAGLTMPVVGSVRTSDQYAQSEPTLLTADGFMLGDYLFFQGGVGPGEMRAFVFRPDLGLTDLGALVSGGLSASGWSTLQRPQFSLLLSEIVGYGLVSGQTSGQSAFVMVPAPGVGAVLGLAAMLVGRRRRMGHA